MLYSHCRRVYRGLLKLLDAESDNKAQSTTSGKMSGHHSSKLVRGVGTLVRYVALGQEVDLEGICSTPCVKDRFHCVVLQYLLKAKSRLRCFKSTHKLNNCGICLTIVSH